MYVTASGSLLWWQWWVWPATCHCSRRPPPRPASEATTNGFVTQQRHPAPGALVRLAVLTGCADAEHPTPAVLARGGLGSAALCHALATVDVSALAGEHLSPLTGDDTVPVFPFAFAFGATGGSVIAGVYTGGRRWAFDDYRAMTGGLSQPLSVGDGSLRITRGDTGVLWNLDTWVAGLGVTLSVQTTTPTVGITVARAERALHTLLAGLGID